MSNIDTDTCIPAVSLDDFYREISIQFGLFRFTLDIMKSRHMNEEICWFFRNSAELIATLINMQRHDIAFRYQQLFHWIWTNRLVPLLCGLDCINGFIAMASKSLRCQTARDAQDLLYDTRIWMRLPIVDHDDGTIEWIRNMRKERFDNNHLLTFFASIKLPQSQSDNIITLLNQMI